MKYIDYLIYSANIFLVIFFSSGSYLFVIEYTILHFSRENVIKGIVLIFLLKTITYLFTTISICEQIRKANNLVKKYSSCTFVEYPIEDYLSSNSRKLLDTGCKDVSMKLVFKLSSLARIFQVKSGKTVPSSLDCLQGTSFPSFIFIKDSPEKVKDFARFVINHEVAHSSISGSTSERIKSNFGSEIFIVYSILCFYHPALLLFVLGSRILTNLYINKDKISKYSYVSSAVICAAVFILNIFYISFGYYYEDFTLVTTWGLCVLTSFLFYIKSNKYHYFDNEILADKMAIQCLNRSELNMLEKIFNKYTVDIDSDSKLSEEQKKYRLKLRKKFINECKNKTDTEENTETEWTPGGRFYKDPESITLFIYGIITKIYLAVKIPLLPIVSWKVILTYFLGVIFFLAIMTLIAVVNFLIFKSKIVSLSDQKVTKSKKSLHPTC